ncbi:bifunctional tetrahydrofolate synthase/dihydrofolate synthase [Cognaticolwellia beringensis]|uniref:Dihydrofolate synthase/folylpolyglutamate synthase n=1 Tax=Cognaticolwellia beringensis TaxID=1967665 RepID=A0A222G9P1_9GAMM|nr:bifunctional tetrahydrofolate synthase/dihydrofolate synthase [Cognaticolwellia beringensis]ASP48618.1 bifunctional tetrahydrofolate synthase/dihydrofolate synthase [Cognaticolwellia beringensis]
MSKMIKGHSERSNLTEWLSYLENLHSVEIDLGLKRIAAVAKNLSIAFPKSTVITVAGTNGKGTTCAFLENAFLARNLTCSVYSSPHIERFNERLRLNKSEVSDNALVSAFETIEAARGDISLTYYEYTTLAALLILTAEQPDVIILEVGLGGRLDATNIIDADVAVITTIDLDHQSFLGNTREAIGFEKAGIMRANQVVVVGDTNPPSSLARHATDIGAKPYFREQSFTIEQANNNTWHWRSSEYTFSALNGCQVPQDNVATAIMVLHLLADKLTLSLNSEFLNQIIAETKVAGRMEKFTLDCDVILDVGHNPQAARYLASQLQQLNYPKVHAVLGMLADKDASNTITPLLPAVSHWYVGTLNAPRGREAKNIVESTQIDAAKVNCFDNVSQAFKMAKQNAKATDLILVFGSFYTVAEIRRLLV